MHEFACKKIVVNTFHQEKFMKILDTIVFYKKAHTSSKMRARKKLLVAEKISNFYRKHRA